MDRHKSQVRRVVAGNNDVGLSCVVEDGPATVRADTAAFSGIDIWTIARVAGPADAQDATGASVRLEPPAGGLIMRVVHFPPDSEWLAAGGYGDSMTAIGGSETESSTTDVSGLHVTATVDLVTVLSGELVAVLEDGETVLHPGDTFIQRGTKHAWSNRTTDLATVLVVLVSATV